MRVDVHQHLWTEPLLAALAARSALPFVRRSGGSTVLYCAGEQPYVIDVDAEAPMRREALVRRDGLDRALIALSSPIGIETLPHDLARELINTHLDGVCSLGEAFGAWGPIAIDAPAPEDVDAVLARGCAGISVPAAALAGPEALHSIGPVLERVALRRVAMFVHPGPTPGDFVPDAGAEPAWWQAMTDYVVQMQAAWLTFAAFGRREHPKLVIVFAMLAGGAPLLSERLEARGGPPILVRDPLAYYETSSYGPVAVEAMAQRVGTAQLVYGSDRPVVEPTPTGREASLQANGTRLLAPLGTAR